VRDYLASFVISSLFSLFKASKSAVCSQTLLDASLSSNLASVGQKMVADSNNYDHNGTTAPSAQKLAFAKTRH